MERKINQWMDIQDRVLWTHAIESVLFRADASDDGRWVD
jgi:hypothetical protein